MPPNEINNKDDVVGTMTAPVTNIINSVGPSAYAVAILAVVATKQPIPIAAASDIGVNNGPSPWAPAEIAGEVDCAFTTEGDTEDGKGTPSADGEAAHTTLPPEIIVPSVSATIKLVFFTRRLGTSSSPES
jgi:hypothetical protein